MTAIDAALERLRAQSPTSSTLIDKALGTAGVGFASIGGPLEQRWAQAVSELAQCVRPLLNGDPVLNEGGVYHGSWIESTGTINAELLSRFAPEVTRATHLLFAEYQREDGMIPYKVTDAGAAFSQIQIVTPLARTVWNHYLLAGRDRAYLQSMYTAMARYDTWLADYRDTRGTGGVEAFCTFDTGHDLSPRFWNVADRGYRDDARQFDPASAAVPFIAPDLTANVACQRAYLALIADELGEQSQPWRDRAAASISALYTQCFDEVDGIFYDRDRSEEFVRVQSDVLLRVLACEIGDAAFFTASLERYLLNTRKFLAHYGFTSIAMDDPRFDHDYTRNSWGGPSNFLSLIRAPHAFEHHGHVAELALSVMPVLSAVGQSDRFPQCLDPWTGTPGFTTVYSPSILWLLDAIERHCGILPRPDGEVWLTGLTPTRLEHGSAAEATAYARRVAGVGYELAGDDESIVVHREGTEWLSFPRGWRVVLNPEGELSAVVGMTATETAGTLTVKDTSSNRSLDLTLDLTLAPNERVRVLPEGRLGERSTPGFVAPRS